MHARSALFAIAATVAPVVASAQVIRGSVSSRADAAGVPGVVVLLIDSTGAIAGRALSGSAGEYRIVAPRAGNYRLRAQRIGFRPDTIAVALAEGQEREQPVVLAGVAVRLAVVRAVEQRTCRTGGAESGAADAWDQARTALMAAQLTERSRAVNATIVLYDRTLDPNSFRVREQTMSVMSGFTVRPWTSLPPDQLHDAGYVVRHPDASVTYYAPDLDVLLSPQFVTDHCFRLAGSRDTTLVGVEFEPTRDRESTSEIKGTIWLARASAELRRLQFRYTNVPDELSDRAAAEIEFVRMTNSGWIISRWGIQTPVLEGVRRGAELEVRVAEVHAVGGELSYVTREADLLYARPALVLTGTVVDSITGQPVIGARVSLPGTSRADTTDAKGAFAIPEVLPGEYALEIRPPGYEAIGARVRWPLIFYEGMRPPRILVPTAAEIAAARAATFTGVVTDTSNVPLRAADVLIPRLGLLAITNEQGAFRIAGVPPGAHEVVVRRVGFLPLTTTLTFPERRTVDKRILLTRLTILDTVVVEGDSPIEEFNVNRKLGLGHFMGRAELEKMRGRQMGSVLSEIKGVGIMRGSGPHWYIGSTRTPGAMSLEQGYRRAIQLGIPEPDTFAWMRQNGYIPPWMWCPGDDVTSMSQGMKCGCYARVYLDRMLLNPGEPSPPFDVNSIMPEQFEALEYYSNPAQVPARYQGRNESCGVLVLHRRRS